MMHHIQDQSETSFDPTADGLGAAGRQRMRIQRELDRVRQRSRSQKFWAVTGVLGCVAVALIWMLRGALASELISWQVFVIASAVVVAMLLLVSRSLGKQIGGDIEQAAAKIEHAFPTLGQRLLTTIDLPESADENSLSRRVVEETHDHYRTHEWRDVVSGLSLWGSRLCGLTACLAIAATLATSFDNSTTSNSLPVTGVKLSPKTRTVTVLPGNVSIERGSSLVVTAEFADEMPESATLIAESSDGLVRETVMKQNLKDPVMAAFISSIDQPTRYRVRAGQWESELYSVDVYEFPELVRSDADLKFPSYTGLEDRVVEDTFKVSVVQGTTVKWIFKLNKAVASAHLVEDDSDEEVTIECGVLKDGVAGNAVAASMTAEKTVRYTLDLLDAEGRKNKYPPTISIKVLPNKPPKIKLERPRDVTVSALEELTLRATVQDDFGLQKAGLTYNLEGVGETEVELADSVKRNVAETLSQTVDFESLGAKPDDMMSFYFWAEDIGPDGERRRTESDLFFADVRPFEQIFRAADSPPPSSGQPSQQGQAQEAGELAEIQKQIVTALWNLIREQSSGKEPAAEDLATIGDSQTEAIGMLDELSQKLNDEKSIEIVQLVDGLMKITVDEIASADLDTALQSAKSSFAGLLKLRAREFQVTKSRQQQSQASGGSQKNQQKQLDELELDQDENRYETQQQAQAQTAQEQAAQEDRQVLSRLRELAQRAEDLNEELAKLQTALENAETPEEEEAVKRQLKRLREQQQELLRQSDELEARMRSAENSQRMSEQADQLQKTRDDINQASKSIEENDPSQALAAGRRAEQELDELTEEFKRRAAGAFDEAVKEMVREAEEIAEQQKKISESMREQVENAAPGLRGDEQTDAAPEQLEKQAERLRQLTGEIENTVRDAEEAEPLLAERLFDAARQVRGDKTEQQLEGAAELMRRGFAPQAEQYEQQAAESIRRLKENIDQAAEAVLGDSAEGLRRASQQLERLAQGVEQELRRENGQQSNAQEGGEPRLEGEESNQGQPNERPGQQPSGNGQENDGQENDGQESGGQQGEASEQDQEQQNSGQGEEREQGKGEQPSQGEGEGQGQSQQRNESQGQSEGQQGQGQQGQGQQGQGQQGQGQGQQSEGQQSEGQQSEGQQSEGQQSEGQQSEGQQSEGQQSEGQQGQGQREGQQGQGQQGQRQSPGLRGESPSSSPGRESTSQSNPGGMAAESESDGGGPIGPLTGDFREWSNQMRDVEEMVGDPELRARAGSIRERVRQMRVDMKRHGGTPKWELVKDLVATPLQELKRDVQAELLRRTAKKNALVPIDRDPVPAEFTEAVRRYYENLGAGR